jgi:hypothetical protein
MKEQFVTYEQALALKELGFDEPCLAYYSVNDELTFTSIVSQNTNSFWLSNPNNIISVPLHQQVFRWFREKYTIDVHIRGTHFRASWVIGIPKEIIPKSKDGYPLVTNWEYTISDGKEVLTYEEAEDACINKLIEIANEQSRN